MLDTVIKKLSVILFLCVSTAIVLYTTDLKALFNGEVKKKVEEFKEETKEKIEAKKEEVQKKVDKVEDKIESNVEKVEDKIKDLKKLKFKDLIK
jgi:flagellar motor switch protein FliM